MNFFDRLRGISGSERDSSSHWIYPSSLGELVERVEDSGKPVLIYKHSDRCATCFMTRRAVEQVMAQYPENADFVFVDVIRNRDLSTDIARQTSVRHQSPQVIILRDGEVVFHTSHGHIRQDVLNEQLEQHLHDK